MTLADRIWLARYIVETRRRDAYARRRYMREAIWCMALAVLTLGGRP